MKTIRRSVFETNSSSTHSITIEATGENINYEPLVEDDTLYPDRIDQYNIDLETGDGGYILSCDTKDKKAALICHWTTVVVNDMYSRDEQEKIDAELELWYTYLSEKLGYRNILIADGNYYPYAEYSEDINFPHEYNEEELNKLVDIILDDSKRIVDKEIPW